MQLGKVIKKTILDAESSPQARLFIYLSILFGISIVPEIISGSTDPWGIVS